MYYIRIFLTNQIIRLGSCDWVIIGIIALPNEPEGNNEPIIALLHLSVVENLGISTHQKEPRREFHIDSYLKEMRQLAYGRYGYIIIIISKKQYTQWVKSKFILFYDPKFMKYFSYRSKNKLTFCEDSLRNKCD